MNTEIEKLLIIFGSAIGVILFGTLLTNRSDKNVKTKKPQTLGRRHQHFLTNKQSMQKSKFHSNKLPTIVEGNENDNSKGGGKSKTLKNHKK